MTDAKMTETEMVDLLRVRYAAGGAGNGPRYVSAPQVRSHAGFDARRTCDFMALDLWPSKGLALHGHEVKVSRSDWLRELKDETKAAEFMQHCDYWWLVCPRGVAQADELPPGWGMLVVAEREVERRLPAEGPPRPYREHWMRDQYRWGSVHHVWAETEQYLRVAKPAPKLTALDTTAAWAAPERRQRGALSKSFVAAMLRAAVTEERYLQQRKGRAGA